MQIEKETLSIIESGHTEGHLYYLPKVQLDRKTYLNVNKVLESLGGKWDRKQKAHVFPEDVEVAIDDVLLTGEVNTPISEKKKYQFFETPKPLAAELVELAEVRPSHFCLEPSAGSGRIAEAMIEAGGKVDCIEINPMHQDTLARITKNRELIADFLEVEARPIYTRITMNPPFTLQQDVEHVSHALDCLHDGGTLVSVMSPGIEFRQNKKTQALLDKLAGCEHYEITDLPDNAFKESGTAVKTVVLRVVK